jgi:hypothetical protein
MGDCSQGVRRGEGRGRGGAARLWLRRTFEMANHVSVAPVSCTVLAAAARTASSTRASTWRRRVSTAAFAATSSLRRLCSLVAARTAAAASAVCWLAL